MNRIEVARLLTNASAYDNRIVTEETIIAWHDVLLNVDYRNAQIAMREHFQKSGEYLQVHHIIGGAKRVGENLDREVRISNQIEARESTAEGFASGRYDMPICVPHNLGIVYCAECSKALADGRNVDYVKGN